MEIQGKVIVVTGGASGIGKAMAERFHREGAKGVVVADLNGQGAEAVAHDIGGIAVQADVTREEDVVRVVRAAEQTFGPIDLFCSNAGISCGTPTLRTPPLPLMPAGHSDGA